MGRAGSRFCRLARVRHHSRWAAPTGRPAPYPARPTNPTPPTELTTEPRNRSHTNRIRRHRITSQGAGFTSSQIYTGNGTPPLQFVLPVATYVRKSCTLTTKPIPHRPYGGVPQWIRPSLRHRPYRLTRPIGGYGNEQRGEITQDSWCSHPARTPPALRP